MAKVSAGAGYKELKRVGNYVAPQVNAAADRLANQASQNRQINVVEKAKADKRKDEAITSINPEALVAKVTGFTGRDDTFRDYAMTANKRVEEHAEAARAAAAKGDWATVENLKGKIKRIQGDFKNMANDEVVLQELFKTYQGKWHSGEIDDEEWANWGDAIEKSNYEIVLDENDNKVVRAVLTDENGKPELDDEGNPKYMEKKWSDVVNQRDRPYEVVRLEDKGGKKGLIGDILSTMGKRKYDTEGNGFITTTQTWDEDAERQFMSKVKALRADDRSMHSILKQASGGAINVKSDFTADHEKLVEDFLRTLVKGGYGEEESLKVRSRTPKEIEAEAARNRALTKRGQDLAQDKANKGNDLAVKKFELDKWKAENPTKSGAPSKVELEKSNSHLAYEIALEIQNSSKGQKLLPLEGQDVNPVFATMKFSDNSTISDHLDSAAKSVGDKYGITIKPNSDWWGSNEITVGGSAVDQDDPHKVAKYIAKSMGFEYNADYAREVIAEKVSNNKKGKKVDVLKTTANMTPQEKIEYYKNLNKN